MGWGERFNGRKMREWTVLSLGDFTFGEVFRPLDVNQPV